MKTQVLKFSLLFLILMALSAVFFISSHKKTQSFSEYLNQAEQAYQKRLYSESVEAYIELLENFPKHPRRTEILLRIGDIHQFDLGDQLRAEQAYQRLVEEYPNDLNTYRALKRTATMWEKTNQAFKAIPYYQSMLKNFPASGDQDQTRLRIALLYQQQKEYTKARKEMMSLLKDFPDSKIADRVFFELANSYFLDNRPNDVLKVLEVALEKYPNSPSDYSMKFLKANALEQLGQLNQAYDIYLQLNQINSQDEVVERKIERIQEELKKLQKLKARQDPEAKVRKNEESLKNNQLSKVEKVQLAKKIQSYLQKNFPKNFEKFTIKIKNIDRQRAKVLVWAIYSGEMKPGDGRSQSLYYDLNLREVKKGR